MYYTVKYGDTLSSIADRFLGSRDRWSDLAACNRLSPVVRLHVGQVLYVPMPSSAHGSSASHRTPPGVVGPHHGDSSGFPATSVPGRAFFFVLADEVNPLRKKVVRRVAIPVDGLESPLLESIMNPDRYGFRPRSPGSPVSVGRHVLGRTDSGFVSASERAFGSERFSGRSFWIDIGKVQASGGGIVNAEDIARDLDRIAAKTKDPERLGNIERIRNLSRNVDREILIEGEIPAAAVKGAGAMVATRAFQFVEGVGIVLTIYDLGKATERSVQTHSIKPIAAEGIRQTGGWAGALAGAELGGMAGAAVGIETGPGAAITGAAGALIFGAAGFFGADWVAHWSLGQ